MIPKIFNIISYGESLKRWKSNEHSPEEITFGVNDVCRYVLTDVDYLLLVDHPEHFNSERIDAIKRAIPYNYFIVDLAWLKVVDAKKCVPVILTKERSNIEPLRRRLFTLSYSDVPFSYNSPFIAACLAYRMGAMRINLFGIDFNTDSAVGYDFHENNITDFQNLYLELKRLGVKMYTTPESRLAEFIPVNPDLSVREIQLETVNS